MVFLFNDALYLLLPDGLISIPRRIFPYMVRLAAACGLDPAGKKSGSNPIKR
jgi:hypothetical protein